MTQDRLLELRPVVYPGGRALRVGLTGGIGAGKSTVATALANLGAQVISADELARTVVARGTPGLSEIVEAFGPEMVRADGTLNREALAQVVFAETGKRRLLEAITHPRIAAAAHAFFEGLPVGAVGVYDVPLLAENNMAEQFDVVLVVEAPLALRLERLEQRGLTREQAHARIGAQATDQQRRQIAHLVLVNDRSAADLERLVKQATERYFSDN